MKFAPNFVFKLKDRRFRRRSALKNTRPQVHDRPNELILDGSSKTTGARFNDLTNELVVDESPEMARTQSNDIPNEPLLDTSSGMARPQCNDPRNEMIPDASSNMAKPQFNDLPNELIVKVFSKLRWTLSEPLLYSECRLAGDSAYIPFIRTVLSRPDLASKVNHLILCPFVLDNSKETIELLRTRIPAFLRPAGIEWYPCDPVGRDTSAIT
ncbi:hypothetical protein W97_00254 [Coniosporium apollinis CBS 100218]|uniref:Uncharacterized protein n=1 Tax=Coniosporium apollinis (strain CBS 100218) TaxID=1168221 RepID=R7YGN4_CONA1|nr:uncharacterized protein W97_00254 [Coniosporium apollinis CBS 100218]EON61043.1 hypothetical protein W97_00254 [Coniosporium apollinis CBS 100218]